MDVQEQIAKLESLLGRIQKNAAKPRPAAAAAPTTTAASVVAPRPAPEELPPLSHSPPTARVDQGIVPMARPTPDTGIAAVQPEASAEVEELDMTDAEIVEIDGGGGPPPIEELDLQPVPADEPVPESAPRAAQALADEADLEPPVKTPPPESGRQIVAPPAPAVAFKEEEAEEADLTGGSDVDDLLQPDHSGGPISKAPPGMPTMEQLGETVELEGADGPGPALELQVAEAVDDEIAPDELEFAPPKKEFHGGYDHALAPPASAASDLERMREADPTSLPAPASLAEPGSPSLAGMPAVRAAIAPAPVAAPAPVEPTVVARPPVDAPHAAEVVVAKPVKLPSTFLEILDLSLGL
ncbi:MAG TPA: hypothetical protein VHE30_15200 [Polyangiaceae bacterium]|nr:hypothetical protein [Polyangiaceae bacterium]